MNHFALRTMLYAKAAKIIFEELMNIKSKHASHSVKNNLFGRVNPRNFTQSCSQNRT